MKEDIKKNTKVTITPKMLKKFGSDVTDKLKKMCD